MLRRIIRAWPLAEQRRFFEEDVGIPLAEEPELRKVFPRSHKARDVVPADGGWRVEFADAEPLQVDAVIVATGGLSAGTFAELARISLTVTLTARAGARAATHSGGFLFTHRGYSGPAALRPLSQPQSAIREPAARHVAPPASAAAVAPSIAGRHGRTTPAR